MKYILGKVIHFMKLSMYVIPIYLETPLEGHLRKKQHCSKHADEDFITKKQPNLLYVIHCGAFELVLRHQ